MVRAFAHGAMGRRIDPSWGGPIEHVCACMYVYVSMQACMQNGMHARARLSIMKTGVKYHKYTSVSYFAYI